MLHRSVLAGTDLRGAVLFSAQLTSVDLTRALLQGADLREARLGRAQLDNANLTGAILEEAVLVNTSFRNAVLTGCRGYGISAWNVALSGARQSNLKITAADEPTVTVDNLEVAHFIYLLLHNEKLRGVIDTVRRKGVLILGRFTTKRKAVLNAIGEKLRKRGSAPILFDFDKPSRRTLSKTARLRRLYRKATRLRAEINPLTSAEIPVFFGKVIEIAPEYYPFFLGAIHTGLRPGELAGLKWDGIDFNGKFIMVRRTVETGRSRIGAKT